MKSTLKQGAHPIKGKEEHQRLSLIQLILLTHLKAGFKKRATCQYGRDHYRPDTSVFCLKLNGAKRLT